MQYKTIYLLECTGSFEHSQERKIKTHKRVAVM